MLKKNTSLTTCIVSKKNNIRVEFVGYQWLPLLRANLRKWYRNFCCSIIELNFTVSWRRWSSWCHDEGDHLAGVERSNRIPRTSCYPRRSTATLLQELVSQLMKHPPYVSPGQIFVPSVVGPHSQWIASILASFATQLFVPVDQSGKKKNSENYGSIKVF